MKSFAQYNEDQIIIDLFLKKNIESGVFVEFGAWDGVHLSNCKLLADNGWNGFSSGEPLTASSAQNEATLTLSSPVECYSFQLRFSGTGKTTFEINDATIVFRLKGQR